MLIPAQRLHTMPESFPTPAVSPRPQTSSTPAAKGGDVLELSEAAQAQLEELQKRDQEVRAHEEAHVAAGGQYVTSGPHYETTEGPDGKAYATEGHVNLDVSKENDPEATIEKARTVRRAALAPGEPSPQDLKVAANASRLETEAQRELQEQSEENPGENPLAARTRQLYQATVSASEPIFSAVG